MHVSKQSVLKLLTVMATARDGRHMSMKTPLLMLVRNKRNLLKMDSSCDLSLKVGLKPT